MDLTGRGDEYDSASHHYYIGLQPDPLRFYGDLPTDAPSRAVDYRIYQPRLMEDFAARGGKIEYRQVSHDDIPSLASQFDLLVVCVGKGPFGQMFEQQPEVFAVRQASAGAVRGVVPGNLPPFRPCRDDGHSTRRGRHDRESHVVVWRSVTCW